LLAKNGNISIKKLEEKEKKEGTLPPLFEFYLKVLRIQSETEQKISIAKTVLSERVINSRIENGKPLVTFNELDIKWSLLVEVARKVVKVFHEYPQLFGEALVNVKSSEVTSFFTKEAVKSWFIGSNLPEGIVSNSANENLLGNIIQAVLSPFLAKYSKNLVGKVQPERWRRRYCPICGGIPDFAYLDKESGARWLLCSRCNTEWLFQRLECPYCGTVDQNKLSYFTSDKELYRLYVCEQCKRYLKVIDLRKANFEVSLPLERLTTLDIDAQAQKQGYSGNKPD
jgi:FdhE protein